MKDFKPLALWSVYITCKSIRIKQTDIYVFHRPSSSINTFSLNKHKLTHSAFYWHPIHHLTPEDEQLSSNCFFQSISDQ